MSSFAPQVCARHASAHAAPAPARSAPHDSGETSSCAAAGGAARQLSIESYPRPFPIAPHRVRCSEAYAPTVTFEDDTQFVNKNLDSFER